MLVYFTIVLVVLMGFCGLAIDVGRIELRMTQLQAAADDAALTAATEAQRQNASYAAAASTEVSTFLAAANLPAATTAVQSTASKGPFTTDLSTLQITVTQQLPLFFMWFATGSRTKTLSVSAVGMVPPCVFLNSYPGAPSNFYPIYLQSASLRGNCPVYANSGIDVDAFSTLGNYQAKVTGPSSRSGERTGSFPSSPPIFNSPVLPDPLAYVTAPTLSGCDRSNKSYNNVITISPGSYCGGTTMTGATVTMSPGLYIFTGGLQIINSSTVTGSGVTMYFTQGGGSGFGTFKLQNSTMHVSAPTVAPVEAFPESLSLATGAGREGNRTSNSVLRPTRVTALSTQRIPAYLYPRKLERVCLLRHRLGEYLPVLVHGLCLGGLQCPACRKPFPHRSESCAMNFFRNEDGSALIEVALIAPVIMAMVLGVVNFGLVLQRDLAVADSARAGAQYALTLGHQTQTSQMAAVATSAAGSIPGYQATAVNLCTCGAGGAAVACTGSCSGYVQPAMYAQVTATANLLILLGTGPSIPVSSVVRVRAPCPACY